MCKLQNKNACVHLGITPLLTTSISIAVMNAQKGVNVIIGGVITVSAPSIGRYQITTVPVRVPILRIIGSASV